MVKRRRRRIKYYYTFYDNITDEILCFGTAEELVEKGFFPSLVTLYSVVSKIRAGKYPNKAVVVEDYR